MMQRTVSAREPGAGWPAALAAPAMRSGMRRGRRYADDCRCGVVRRDGCYGDVIRDAPHDAWLLDWRQHLWRDAKPIEERRRPLACANINEACCRSMRVLRAENTGQPERDEVGEQDYVLGLRPERAVLLRGELVDGVERQEL